MRNLVSRRSRLVLWNAGLACALLLSLVSAGHAESVYKCRSADGALAFQDRPCASSQSESRVEILPPPPPAPSPDYGRAHEDRRVAARATHPRRGGEGGRREPVSFECRAANGELFYRHGACPRQISASESAAGSGSRRSGRGVQTVPVFAQALPRSDVCRRIASAGSIGRAGHERDETVSTYDRNLGRDPCRHF